MKKNNLFWEKFNKNNFKLGLSQLFDKKVFKNEIIYPYNQINEIRSIFIILLEVLKKKVSFLDYGGSLISNAYLFSKSQKRFRGKNFFKNISCSIFNPQYNFLKNKNFLKFKKKIEKKTPINFINKIPKTKKYDLVIFGSCLQYEKKLSNIDLFKKKKPEFILITQTPISESNKSYECIQQNHKALNYVHTLNDIKKKLLKNRYEIIYISSINPVMTGFKKKDYFNKVSYLNIIFKLL